MTKYRVEIKEILSRIVEIEADNEKDAIDTVRRMYRNCDLILDASDYEKTEISVKRWKNNLAIAIIRDKSLTLHRFCGSSWALANFVELDSSI